MAGSLPDFDSLPIRPGLPKGCAWGVFDKAGKKDIYGTLNILTPEVIREAYKEARDGVHVSLNWGIGALATPSFGRTALQHKVISFWDAGFGVHGFDDEVTFNTQNSSQWDSLCHFHHQETASAYNGFQPTADALKQPFGKEDKEGTLPTLNHWHQRGGLVARGVFIDFRRWADANNRPVNEFGQDVITIEDLETVAKWQGVEFRPGDVLIVRSGFTEALGAMSDENQVKAQSSGACCGVEGSERAARWFWNHHFAAVAGDMIAFEHIPPILPDGSHGTTANLVLHQYFLGLFGLPIGELWDLKALSEHCEKVNRYSFLLSSIPLNVPGGIGSPPNAIAMF